MTHWNNTFRKVCPQLCNTVYNIIISHHNPKLKFLQPVSAGDLILILFTWAEKPIEGNWAIYVGYWCSWVCVQISWLALTQFHERIPAVSVCSPVSSAEGKLICYPDVNKCASRNGPLHIQQWITPLDFTWKLTVNRFLCLLLKAEHWNWNIIPDFDMLRKIKQEESSDYLLLDSRFHLKSLQILRWPETPGKRAIIYNCMMEKLCLRKTLS